MAELVLVNVKYWVGGVDLSGSYNMHALALEADAVPADVYGMDGFRQFLAGLKAAGSEHQGFWSGPVDNDHFTNVGAAARTATIAVDGTDGEVAYFYQTIGTSYAPGGQVGDAFAFAASDKPSGDVTRGRVMAIGAKTTDGNGAARQLGTVTAGKSIAASLHVLAVAGASPELDVIVESDSVMAFSDDPQTRLTFPTVTAPGGVHLEAAGPFTGDSWWRVAWDVGADTTSADFVIAVGIH